MSNAAIEFNADIGKFVVSMDGISSSVAKSAQAVADAKNRILQSFEQQKNSALQTGASAQQLASIQTKAAQSMASVTETNAGKIISALDRISARQKAVAAELGNLKVPEVHDSNVSDRMRASALLRGGGLRASENFASQFDVFNKIATLAFPILGLATLTEEAVKFGQAMYEAFDLGSNRARQTAAEVLGVSNALRDSSTSLDVQIDKLQQEQAKLEHKPFNGLKLALDEAAEASENLQKHLASVLELELKVITGMSASVSQQILTGGSSTHQEQVMIGEHNRHLQEAGDINGQLGESVSYRNALQQRLAELQGKQADNASATAAAAKQGAGGLTLTTYKEEIQAVQTLLGYQSQEQSNIQKTIDLQKQMASTQTARNKHGAEGIGNKADEERLKSMETYVATWKTLAPVSAKAIYDYWEVQKSTFSTKSNEFAAIVSKQAELATAGAEKFHAGIEKLKASIKESSTPVPAELGRNLNFSGNTADSDRSLNRTGLATSLGNAEAQAQVDKTKVAIEEASGVISKLSAIEKTAAIDTALHTKRLADLNEQLAELKKNSGTYDAITGRSNSDKDQQTAIGLQGQITKESAAASVDTLKTAADEAGQTWSGALRNANAQWVQDSQNSAKQVAALYTQVMNGVNNDLTGLLTGEHLQGRSVFATFKNNLGNTAAGVGKSLVNTGLQRGEAALFGHALGKPDGSASNPLNVKVVDGAAGGIGGGLSKLFGKSSGDDDDDSSGVGGFVSKIGGFFSSIFGGAKAVGGDVTPGHIYRMNESGQELFAPSVSGKILPAGSSSGGGSGDINFNVNVANGVTPEQMNMHVRAALQEYHPHAVAASVAAVRDSNRRSASRR